MECDEYKGYAVFFTNIPYSCPRLKLYGYSTEKALHRAIDRELKKKGKV